MTLPDKKEVCDQILRKKYSALFVHLDPRHKDVKVPPWLRHQAQLVLQFGYDMSIPIPDLRVDEKGISGTLSFSRSPFTCFVPWDAVFTAADDNGRGMMWPASMPDEVAAKKREQDSAVPVAEPVKARVSKRAPHLSVIDGGKKMPKRNGFSFRGGNGGPDAA